MVLAVRFCSIYFAAVPLWCHWPPLLVAVLAMATIAALRGALSEGQELQTEEQKTPEYSQSQIW